MAAKVNKLRMSSNSGNVDLEHFQSRSRYMLSIKKIRDNSTIDFSPVKR